MPIKSLSRSSLLTFEKYSSLLAGNDPYIPFISDYDLLETEILGGSQTSVTFSSLNSNYGADYQHLQIRMATRSDRPTGSNTNLNLVINADTGSNYSSHQIYFTTGLGAAGGGSASSIYLGPTSQPASGTNVFGVMTVDILDPFHTSKNTTVRGIGGFATGALMLTSGAWLNTNAVSSLQIICEPSNNFVTGSRFSLYGLKKASA